MEGNVTLHHLFIILFSSLYSIVYAYVICLHLICM